MSETRVRVISSKRRKIIDAIAERLEALGMAVERANFKSHVDWMDDSYGLRLEESAAEKPQVDGVLARFGDPDLRANYVEATITPLNGFTIVFTVETALDIGGFAIFKEQVEEMARTLDADILEVSEYRENKLFDAILVVPAPDRAAARAKVQELAEALPHLSRVEMQ